MTTHTAEHASRANQPAWRRVPYVGFRTSIAGLIVAALAFVTAYKGVDTFGLPYRAVGGLSLAMIVWMSVGLAAHATRQTDSGDRS